MPGKEDPDPGSTGRLEHPRDPFGDLPAIGELADDADLHVVDDQSDAIGVADVRQRVGDRKVAMVLHGDLSQAVLAGQLATVVVRS